MTDANLTITDRIRQLMQYLGIDKAHFAGRMPRDWVGSVTEYPDQVLSLTLVCPPSHPLFGHSRYRCQDTCFQWRPGAICRPRKANDRKRHQE